MNKEPRDINSPAMKKEFLAWLESKNLRKIRKLKITY